MTIVAAAAGPLEVEILDLRGRILLAKKLESNGKGAWLELAPVSMAGNMLVVRMSQNRASWVGKVSRMP